MNAISRSVSAILLTLMLILPVTNATAQDTTGINVLLMGVDKAQTDAWDVGVRPDSLSILHLDPATGSCRLLGIPRDSRVEVPNVGLTKINHALNIGGLPLQQRVIENYLGITIDHYGMIDFSALIGAVDAVGGITVNNPYTFELGGMSFAAGEIELDGEHALMFSRYRYGPDGDFGRIEKQQLVMKALLGKLSSANVIQAVPGLLQTVEGHFRTDLTLPEMINLATQFQSTCTTETLETRTLVGANMMFADPVMNLDLWYVVTDPADVDAAVQWLLTGM